MTTREFSRGEILDMDPEEIGAQPWRHGRRATFVFTDDDGHSWRFTADVHHDEGIQLDGTVTCTEVRHVERKVMVWEPTP